MEIVWVCRHLLPRRIKPPDIDAGDNKLLRFYSRITPKRINALIKRTSKLSYPIIDMNDFKDQLGLPEKKLSQADIDLISSLRITDFPLVSLRATLVRSIDRSYAERLATCKKHANECVRRAKKIEDPVEREKAMSECGRNYHKCIDDAGPGGMVPLVVSLPPLSELGTLRPVLGEPRALRRLLAERIEW